MLWPRAIPSGSAFVHPDHHRPYAVFLPVASQHSLQPGELRRIELVRVALSKVMKSMPSLIQW